MSLPLERTLSDLRSEIQAGLGFANQGAPSLLQRTLLNSFLRRAQVEIYWLFNDEEARQQTHTITTAIGQTLYDWPDNFVPSKRWEVEVLVDTIWFPVFLGIEREHDSIVDSQRYPQRWDYNGGQFEVWPEPDDEYTVRFEDYGQLAAFSQDGHRASVDSELLFELALYMGKAHYRQPDAEVALNTFNTMLGAKRGHQHRGRRYIRGRSRSSAKYEDPYGRTIPVRVV